MTSGISLFNYRNYFGNWTHKGNFFKMEGSNPQPLPEHKDDPEKAIQIWLNAAQELIQQKGSWKEESVSAEYSMLHALKRQNKLREYPFIALFHTNTLGGTAAAKLLKYIIERDFSATVELHTVNIDVADRVSLNRSLGDYMGELNDVLRQGHPSGTCFAPIGGYKVMTSFGYIVGSFCGYPTAYLHEDAQQMLHIIPPVPIDIDDSFVRKNALFLRRLNIEGLLGLDALSREEKSLVEENPALFTIEENYVYLNPFGEFLFSREQYRSQLQTKVYISDAVRKVIDANPSQKRFVFQQISVLLQYMKDSEVEKRGELFHERDFEPLKGKELEYHLYKGASNGGLFRGTWRYDKQNDELYINYIWLSKPYEDDIIKGKGLEKPEGKFHDVTKEVYERF